MDSKSRVAGGEQRYERNLHMDILFNFMHSHLAKPKKEKSNDAHKRKVFVRTLAKENQEPHSRTRKNASTACQTLFVKRVD